MGLSDAKQYAEALRTAGRIDDPKSRSAALFNLAIDQYIEGDRQGAKTTSLLAKQAAIRVEEGKSRSEAMAAVFLAQSMVGDTAEAEASFVLAGQIVDKIADPKTRIDAVLRVAEYAHQTGNSRRDTETTMQRVARLITEARETVAQITDAKVRAEAELAIVEVQKKAETRAGARAIAALVSAGDFSGAKAMVGQLTDPALKIQTLRDIANQQAKAGDFVGARETVELIADPGERITAEQILVQNQTLAGDIEGAGPVIGLMQKTLGQMADQPARDKGISWLITAQMQAGDRAGALAALRQIADEHKRDVATSQIARNFATKGDSAAAQELADQIVATKEKASAELSIGVEQVKAGNFTEAMASLRLVQQMAETMADTGFDKSGPYGSKIQVQFILAGFQTDARDLTGALETLRSVEQTVRRMELFNGWRETISLETRLAEAQAKAGDFAAALANLQAATTVADRIVGTEDRLWAMDAISSSQTRITALGAATGAVVALPTMAGPALFPAASSGPPIEARVAAGEWMEKIGWVLNEPIHLDFPGTFQTLTAGNPSQMFQAVAKTAERLIVVRQQLEALWEKQSKP